MDDTGWGTGAGVIPVVAAVVRRGDRYLVGLRPGHKRHGGCWEFPGGKLEAGEGAEEALRRELAEELGLTLAGCGGALFEARDPGSPFRIRFVEVEVRGEPLALEHTRVGWFTATELQSMPLAPTDRRFVEEAILPTPFLRGRGGARRPRG